MVDAAVENFGGLHVAFNNAGITEKTTFADITDEQTSKMIDVNFKSLVFCFKYQVSFTLVISFLPVYPNLLTGTWYARR